MASLILRPVASKGVVASTVPADTSVEEIYKLINEEVADDDTTNFTPILNNAVSNLDVDITNYLFLKYQIPENLVITSLTDVKHTSRKSATGGFIMRPVKYSNQEFIAGRKIWNSDDDGWTTETEDNSTVKKFNSTSSYDDDSFDENFETMKELLNSRDFGFGYMTTASKNVPSVSQTYIELVCEFEELSKPFYFKQGGAWAELSGNIYQKANGEWLEADVSVLNGEYPIEEIIN